MMDHRAIRRLELDSAHPTVPVQSRGNNEAPVGIFAARRRDVGAPHPQDEIRLAEPPLIIEDRRRRERGRISFRGACLCPCRQRPDFGVAEPAFPREMAIPGRRFPGRHLPFRCYPRNQLCPSRRLLIGDQRKGRNFSPVMARCAVPVQDRRNLAREGWRR